MGYGNMNNGYSRAGNRGSFRPSAPYAANGSGCGCRTNASLSRTNNSYDAKKEEMISRSARQSTNENDMEGIHACKDCNILLAKLQTLDFTINEVVLYLDMYPDCDEALDMYHHLIAQRKEILAQYECTCGPISGTGNKSHCSWEWVKGPMPWEYLGE